MSRFQYFTAAELACRCDDCTLGEDDINARFMRRIVELRKRLDFPFIVSSAIRCPDHNDSVSSTGRTGPHTTGHALDIRIYGHRAFKLLSLASNYGVTGVGSSQRGPHTTRFIHLDDLPDSSGQPRPWVWTY